MTKDSTALRPNFPQSRPERPKWEEPRDNTRKVNETRDSGLF